MAKPAYLVTGLNEVLRDVRRLGLDLDDLKDAMHTVAAEAARVTRRHVPVRSGRLAGTVRPNKARSRARVTVGYARRAPYAGVNNYGWPARGYPASEFVAATDREMEPRSLSILEREIDKKIRAKGLT